MGPSGRLQKTGWRVNTMYTLCPHCSTCFRITSEQVNAAQGNVRCGNCGAVFNALDNPGPEPDSFSDSTFVETEPFSTELYKPVDDELYPDDEPNIHEETDDQFDDQEFDLYAEPDFIPLGEGENDEQHSFFDEPDRKTEDTEHVRDPASTTEIASQLSEHAVEELHEYFVDDVENTTIEELEKLFLPDDTSDMETTSSSEPATAVDIPPESPIQTVKPSRSSIFINQITLSIGSLLLITLLLGQYIFFSRDHLAQQYPGTRPLLEKMCGYLECKLALQRDLSKLQLTHRDVRSHPTTPDALLINATFVNKATFPQPYPAIELKLSNLNGRLVGRRIFQPNEYLAGSPDIDAGIPPNTQVYLVLELADPGKQAVNFEFDFR